MITDHSLIYFIDYTSIVQVHIHIIEMSIHENYSDDMLFHLLSENKEVCKTLAHQLQDKSKLMGHIFTFKDDSEWLDMIISNMKHINDDIIDTCFDKGYIHIFKKLINQGIDVNVFDHWIHTACENGHFEIIKYTLDEGLYDSKYNISDSLVISAKYGHCDIFSYLLEKGADVNVESYICFGYICLAGNLELAKHILELVDDKVKCISSNDDFAIEFSSEYGHLVIVQWLVDNGADWRADNYYVFRNSCINENFAVAEYLLSLCEDSEEKMICLASVDDYMMECLTLNVVKFLLNNGFNVVTIFQEVCCSQDIDIAKYIMEEYLINDEERRALLNSKISVTRYYVINTNEVNDYLKYWRNKLNVRNRHTSQLISSKR